MRILIVGLIVLALSVAGISTYLIQNFSTQTAIEELEKKNLPKKYQVLVAVRPFYPGEKVIRDAIAWLPWPEDGVNEKYIVIEEEDEKDARTKEIVDSIARSTVQAGEPILASKFYKSSSPGFMAGMLDKGMRAVSIAVNNKSGVSGFVLPGNYIDILIVHNKGSAALKKKSPKKSEADASKPLILLATTTETILTNIKVIAVNQIAGKVEGQALPATTLTLQLTKKQVEILTTAQAMGKLTVALRDISAAREDKLAAAQSVPATYTTDVEVSPFLQKLNAGLLYKQKTREQKLNEEISKLQSEKQDLAETAEAQIKLLSNEKQRAIMENRNKLNAKIQKLEAQKDASEKQAIKKREEFATEKEAQELAAKAKAEEERGRQEQTAKKPRKSVPVEKKTEVIEIYRGGASKTQEIKIK